MWIISKFKSREYSTLNCNLQKHLNKEAKIYSPKIRIKLKNSKKYLTKFVLGNYLFIYHRNFSNKKFINLIKNLKGLEYILTGFQYNQDDIEKFINHCKEFEDNSGYLTQGFFNFEKFKNKGYFVNGPFSKFVFDILEKKTKRLKITIANLKITLKKNSDYLFCPLV